MRHRWAIWVPPGQSGSKSSSAFNIRSGVLVKLRRPKAYRVAFPLLFQTEQVKGTSMSSDDTQYPVVLSRGPLTHTSTPGQQSLAVRPHGSARSTADCGEGSDEFYSRITPGKDRFVPSYLEARPLNENVGACRTDGTYPPWIIPGSTKSPCQQYVEWFNGIWQRGDPSQWDASVFTNNCVTIDPSGLTTGAEESALNFVMLFRFFPDLRGEVVSWSANESELFINWRFRIPNNVKDRLPIGPITQTLQEQQGGEDFLVPVIDKFCFVDGLVSFRAAYFDVTSFSGYLSRNLSANQLYDYLIAWTWKSLTSGGVPFLLKMVVNLFLGLFVWPPTPKDTGLVAFAGDRVVTLKWPSVQGATSYRLRRATAIEGPYKTLPLGGTHEQQNLVGNTYTDWNVTDGTPYWYTISPILQEEKWATIQESLNIASERRSTI
jgi:hypothetical protein